MGQVWCWSIFFLNLWLLYFGPQQLKHQIIIPIRNIYKFSILLVAWIVLVNIRITSSFLFLFLTYFWRLNMLQKISGLSILFRSLILYSRSQTFLNFNQLRSFLSLYVLTSLVFLIWYILQALILVLSFLIWAQCINLTMWLKGNCLKVRFVFSREIKILLVLKLIQSGMLFFENFISVWAADGLPR